jgi:hypothetical protein
MRPALRFCRDERHTTLDADQPELLIAARQPEGDASDMTTLMITHDVDDVESWLASPKREEFFGPLGISARPFVDSDRSNHVGLVVDVPDLDTLQQALASPEAAAAMKHDGVRPETIHIMVAS